MKQILKVVLLILFLGILANRLYHLYYGISNVVTTISICAFVFMVIYFLVIQFKFLNHYNSKVILLIGFLSLIGLELGLRYLVKQYQQPTEKTTFGSYHSPFRTILLDNKQRAKQGSLDVGIRLNTPNSFRNETNAEFNFKHQYNEFGLRAISFDKTQIDTSFIVLGLGDSFMEGVGVPQQATCMNYIQQYLKDSIQNLLTVNAGFRGSDPIFELYKLKEFLIPVYHPDIVILSINETDINDLIIRGGNERFINKSKVVYKRPPWWEYLYAFSYITRQITHKICHKNWFYQSESNYRSSQLEAVKLLCKTIYSDFNNLANQHNFELIVTFIPLQHEVELNWITFNGCQKLLDDKQITTVNMLPQFEGLENDLQSYFWEKDRHLTSKGHAFWGKNLSEKVLEVYSNLE